MLFFLGNHKMIIFSHEMITLLQLVGCNFALMKFMAHFGPSTRPPNLMQHDKRENVEKMRHHLAQDYVNHLLGDLLAVDDTDFLPLDIKDEAGVSSPDDNTDLESEVNS